MFSSTPQLPSLRHWLMLAILVFCWGSAIILTRVAVSDISPLWVTAGRLSTGAIALLFYRFAILRKPWSLGWHHAPWVVWLALMSSAVPFLLIAWGTQFTSSAIAGILMGTVPLSVMLMAHLLLSDEKLTRSKAVGFLIGFVGVVLIIKPDLSSLSATSKAEVIGQIAIFIASFCYALNSVSTRRMPPADNIDKATAVVTTAATLLIIAALGLEPNGFAVEASIAKWSILLYLGLVPTAFATLVLFTLLSQTTAGFVATSNYLIPVFTALGGITLLGETLSPSAWIGFAVIMLGIAISERKLPLPMRKNLL
ncbi:Permease of the drug/metabolite transporter (DMT) superfamily [Cohaesibacter sp. ES.047]|uniref:DMT family transporter n=1 Tax=Cohaesibacter sp. ES.047 TaxID=1798205 RepID=UPI000BB8EF3A|nr:DMT family transporter [Cohaesibacter sp. ES.047]SNY90988.1 Permease of the drug/metabolite transporter (DMT) superfamily [Cohaesibacter sp. ES.047]